MNLQQHEERISALEAKSDSTSKIEVDFIKATVGPINSRLAALETAVSQLQSDLKAITGK